MRDDEFDDDDEAMFRKRSEALHALEDDEPVVGEEDAVFEGSDDISEADEIIRAMPTSDSLAHKAELRKYKWSDLKSIAPFARVNPPSVLQGTLGGQQLVASGPGLIDPQTNAIIPGNAQVALWEGVDAETLPVTVTLSSVSPVGSTFAGDNPTVGLFRPFGIVQFGTRGFMVNVEVDIGTGCEFTISGSAVSVQVALEQTAHPAPFPVAAGTMQLSGMLSFYPIVRTSRLTRTKYFDADAVTTATVVARPKFAENFIIPGVFSQTLAINYLDSQGNILYSTPVVAGASMPGPVDLSGGVFFIAVSVGVGFLGSQQFVFGLDI